MDLVTYDPAIPELPLLRGLRLEPVGPERFDWASYVIRLARAVAGQSGGPTSPER